MDSRAVSVAAAPAAPARPAVRHGGAPGGAAEEAARGFAALLLAQLLRLALGADGLPGGALRAAGSGPAAGYYGDLLVEGLARQIAASPGFPLTEQLRRYLLASGSPAPAVQWSATGEAPRSPAGGAAPAQAPGRGRGG